MTMTPHTLALVLVGVTTSLSALGGTRLAVTEFTSDTWSEFKPLGTLTTVTDGVTRAHHFYNLQGRMGGALNATRFVPCRANAEVEFTFEAKGRGGANVVLGLLDATHTQNHGRFLPRFELTPDWKEYRVVTRVTDEKFPTAAVSFRFRAFQGADVWLRNVHMQVDKADAENFEGTCSNLTERPDAIVTQFIAPGLCRNTATACYRGRPRVIAFRDNAFAMPHITKTATFDSSVRIYPSDDGRRHDYTLNMNFQSAQARRFMLQIQQQEKRGTLACSLVESDGSRDTVLGTTDVSVSALPGDFRLHAGWDGRVTFEARTLADASKVELTASTTFFTDSAEGFTTALEFQPAHADAEIILDEYAVGAGLCAEQLQPVPFTVESLPTFDPRKAGWPLILQDDFNGTNIDEKVWEIHPHGTGYWADYEPDLAFVSNGLLHIRADWNGAHDRLKTASVRSHQKYLYGYFEAKVRFTREAGWWAAFWLYRKNAVTNPFLDGIEYDIFEDYFTRSATPNGEHKGILDHNIHSGGCGDGSTHKNWKFRSQLPGSLDDFYVIGCRWTPFETAIYLNGKLVGAFNAVDHATTLTPLQPILSVQIMNKTWPNSNPKGFQIPEDFLVDWVRVYGYPQPDKPRVTLTRETSSHVAASGETLHFTVQVQKPADGAAIKAVYLFDSGYLLEFARTPPYAFDIPLTDAYYGTTRWAQLGLVGSVGKTKPTLKKAPHHAFAAFALDDKGRYAASDVLPVDIAPHASKTPTSAVRDDPLKSVIPYPLDYEGGLDKLSERLLAVRDLCGISRFALYAPRHVVRLTGVKTPTDYAAYGRTLKALRDRLGPRGITCGYLAMPTINIGIHHPGRDYVCENGATRPFTGCPRDPAFRALLISNLVAVARVAQPPFIMLEDDFRFFGTGCFCTEHLAAFDSRTTRTWTREDLHDALRTPGSDLAPHWQAFQTEALVTLASELERAVGAVSPHTRIGLSAPGGLPARDSLRIAQAAAGARTPFVRWYGIGYGSDVPVETCRYLQTAQWAREHLTGHEFFYEADAVPHTVLFGSAIRMTAFMEKAFAMGFDRMWFWGLGTGAQDLAESPDFLLAYRDNVSRFAEIQRLGKMGRPLGVQACEDWYAPLNRLGFPVTTADAAVRFVAGKTTIAQMTDAEIAKMLAGRVVLDGSAATALVSRGFGNMLGLASCGSPMTGCISSNFKQDERQFVDFTGERMTDGSWTSGHFECAFHQGYGLDTAEIADLTAKDADEVAYYFLETPDRRVRPSILRYTNPAGGRVVTFALCVWNLKSPNLFNFARRETLARLITWLGGSEALPIRVSHGATLYVLARETDEGLFVHATSLTCDARQTHAFAVSPKWQNGQVEILGSDGRWQDAPAHWEDAGRSLRLTHTLPAFGSMALRLKPATH